MKLTIETIKNEASDSAVYSRGLNYMKSSHVRKATFIAEDDGGWTVIAKVAGNYLYNVEVTINPEGQIAGYSCTCEAIDNYEGLCKHCVAALLYAQKTLSQQGRLDMDTGEAKERQVTAQKVSVIYQPEHLRQQNPPKTAPVKARTDASARNLLSTFAIRETEPSAENHDISFIPTLEVGSFTRGIDISFTVGRDKQYVVKSLRDFILNVDARRRVSYGKGLTFTHSLSSFNKESRDLILFIKKWYYECKAAAQGSYRFYSTYGDDERRIKLSPDALNEFFDVFNGQTFISSAGTTAPLEFSADRPEIIVETMFTPDGALKLIYNNCPNIYIGRQVFIMSESKSDKNIVVKRTVFRCDSERSAVIAELMKAFDQSKGVLTFAEEDIPAFCVSVMPEIQAHVKINDSEDRLNAYLPEPMNPHLYLDAPGRSKITGLPVAEYGGDLINMLTGSTVSAALYGDAVPENKPAGKGALIKHRRDVRAENKYIASVGSIMNFEPPGGFSAEGDEAVYLLLTEGIERLRSLATVHISDRLRRYAVNPPFKTSIGVSLDGGLLKMDINTGGLPPEQLISILEAYREKRKYYRLKDGSFMKLSEGAFDDFIQLADGLQLTDKQISSGHAEVPAFRTLYLDGLFNEKNSGLTLSRNEAFLKLAQSMKDFGKNAFAVPETLIGILRGYQETGYRWLRSLEECSLCGILADDMGLGKSLQLIALLLSRYNSTLREQDTKDSSLPSLIVCPASLILNWKSELNKFAPSLPVRIIAGAAPVRKTLIADIAPYEIVITSYDLLKKDIDLYTHMQFHYFAIDEAQYIKNQNTKSAQAVKQVVCTQRFALTGTPIENRLSELWSIFDFLMPGYLYSYTRFKQKFELPVVKNEDETARAQLRRLIAPFILRRLKSEVLSELPPKVSTVIPVELDKEQRNIYNAVMTAGLQQLRSDTKASKTGEAKMKIFALMTRLRQICCDPSLCYEDYNGESAKLEACLELLNEAKNGGHKVLLFSQFTSMLDILRKRLDGEGISHMTLQGSTPKEKRLDMVESFNRGLTDVFLISLKAGGTGLNLTGANVVIHYDPWWNMAAQEQATDRAHRIGQTQSVQVYKLIAVNTLEERIMRLQEMKGDLASVIEADGEQPLLNMTVEDMMELFESR